MAKKFPDNTTEPVGAIEALWRLPAAPGFKQPSCYAPKPRFFDGGAAAREKAMNDAAKDLQQDSSFFEQGKTSPAENYLKYVDYDAYDSVYDIVYDAISADSADVASSAFLEQQQTHAQSTQHFRMENLMDMENSSRQMEMFMREVGWRDFLMGQVF